VRPPGFALQPALPAQRAIDDRVQIVELRGASRPGRTQLSSRLRAAQVLLPQYFGGPRTDSGTIVLAAKCMTVSIRCSRNTAATSSRSPMSPTISGADSIGIGIGRIGECTDDSGNQRPV
jgi:hypothetical protein